MQMRSLWGAVLVLCFTVNLSARADAEEPMGVLSLHPDNPHYFLWHGKPTVLITSADHYGDVLNLDFDYAKYLGTLAKYGFNLTRTFSGAAYLEPAGAFSIKENVLAPKAGKYLAPWARSDQPGAWDGGNKWDLSKWNDDYFKRVRDFASHAQARGIVIEMNLFCPFYEDKKTKESRMWPLSPFHPSNNINGLGNVSSHDVYTLDKNGGLLAVQERFVRRIVEELKDFDNVYYEICNEPYFAGVTLDWQRHIAEVIEDAQKNHPAKKLISQNIANRRAKIQDPIPAPAVSIFNFHYAYPPDTVAENYGLNKVIGENETGFRGPADEVYRNEAWDFLLAGGGLFNNLDYSYTAGHEDGTFEYPPSQPGGGGPTFHQKLAVLVKFMNKLDFVKMKPANDMVKGLAAEASVRLLANPGKEYAAYLHHSAAPAWKDSKKLNAGKFRDAFTLEVPAGNYRVEWVDPETGTSLSAENRTHGGGAMKLETPEYARDIALHIAAVRS
jgi:hypothetical protein